MLRRKTHLVEGEARDEGASAELSDMRRRGSSDARRDTSQGEETYPPTKDCGAYRREDDGSGGAGSGREAETPSTAPNSRGCPQDCDPKAYMYTPSGRKDARIGHFSRASTVAAKQAARWKANQHSTSKSTEP